MKSHLLISSLLIFSLSFFPFAFSRHIHYPFSPPVLDVKGNELKLGAPYYVLSNAVVHPEGLCLADVKNQSVAACPHDVVQCTLFDKSLLGLPLIFSPDGETEDAVVRESTSYNLQFSVAGDCSKETAWSLVDVGIPIWKNVGTDPDTPPAQFQLQKSGIGYNIAFCKAIPIPGSPFCFGLGFIPDGLYSRLGTGLGVESVQFFFVSNETAVENLPGHLLA